MVTRAKNRGGIRLFTSVGQQILVIVGFISISLVAATFFWAESEREGAREIQAQIANERGATLRRVLSSETSKHLSVAKDNSTWTELANFIKKPDPNWAKANLDYSFVSHELDVVTVFDANGKAVYASGSTPEALKTARSTKFRYAGRTFTKPMVDHWYERTGSGVMEVVVATIHRSEDSNRTAAPSGVLMFGRLWDKGYLDRFGKLTGSTAEIMAQNGVLQTVSFDRAAVNENKNVVNHFELQNQKNELTATLRCTTKMPSIRQIEATADRALFFAAMFAATFFVSVALSLNVWIIRPLRQVGKALSTDDVSMVDDLQRRTNEFGKIGDLIHAFHMQQEEIRATNQELQAAISELSHINEQLEYRVDKRTKDLAEAYEATIEGWSRAMEVRDHETQGHCQRVTEISMILARRMGVQGHDLVRMRRGALLHDIGKMGVPDGILLKPGRLTAEERHVMEQHPIIAYEMLKPIKFLSDSLDVPLYHHEKWDGTGYPYGLHAESIPLNARIFAVADVWDAMRSDRPYREAWDEERTRAFITENSGSHFDPQVVEAYLSIPSEELEKMREASMGHNTARDHVRKAA